MQVQSPSELKSDASSLLSPEPKYGVSPYRFVILILYVISCNQTMLVWGIFVPLQSTVQTVYNESLLIINLSMVVTAYITYFFSAPFVNYCINHYGLRKSIIIGSLLTAIGLWIRCLSEHGFVWIFIGQCIAFLAQPFYFATPQKFSNVWFAPHERNFSTGLMQVTQNIGTIVGPLMAQGFINLNADNATIIHQLNNLMFFTAIMASVSLGIMILFMREKPAIPPSKAAIAVKYDIMTSLKQLLRNGNAMLMITSTSLVNAAIWSYIGIFQQMILPFGFDADKAGTIMSISIGIGLFGMFGGAEIGKRYRTYSLVINTSTVIAWLALIAAYFAVEKGSFLCFCIAFTICQFSYASATPAALEYGVELAFPVEEATMGSVWYLLNQLGAIVGNLVGDALLGNTPTISSGRTTFIFFIAFLFVSFVPNFFVKPNLRRQQFESNTKGSEENYELRTPSTIIESQI